MQKSLLAFFERPRKKAARQHTARDEPRLSRVETSRPDLSSFAYSRNSETLQVLDPVQPDRSAKRHKKTQLSNSHNSVPSITDESTSPRIDDSDAVAESDQKWEESDEAESLSATPLVSDYEKRRLENLRRNAEMLRSLDLQSAFGSVVQPKPKHRPKRRQLSSSVFEHLPRRSTRSSQPLPETSLVQVSRPQPLPTPIAPPLEYADSSLSECFGDYGKVQCGPEVRSDSPTDLRILRSDLGDPRLTRVYSFHFHTQHTLLAAAGHAGRATVIPFGEDETSPIMSFKAHKGWLSGVHFVDCASKKLLLTSANDMIVKVWDLSQVAVKGEDLIPQIVHENDQIHTGGIFGLDECNLNVATASKDTTVAISRLTPSGLERLLVSESHSAVVKSVQFHDEQLVASAGNDREIHLLDIRSPKSVQIIDTDHNAPINNISWRPSHTHDLLTASGDGSLKLWDIRNQSQSRLSIQVMRATSKIHVPSFFGPGTAILSTVDGSHDVCLYDPDSGAEICRRDMGTAGTNVAQCENGVNSSLAAVATSGGRISILGPKWK